MNSPRITVLMTVYNGLPYIAAAVESILSQTFTDFEFLIINDGSLDDSMAAVTSTRTPSRSPPPVGTISSSG